MTARHLNEDWHELVFWNAILMTIYLLLEWVSNWLSNHPWYRDQSLFDLILFLIFFADELYELAYLDVFVFKPTCFLEKMFHLVLRDRLVVLFLISFAEFCRRYSLLFEIGHQRLLYGATNGHFYISEYCIVAWTLVVRDLCSTCCGSRSRVANSLLDYCLLDTDLFCWAGNNRWCVIICHNRLLSHWAFHSLCWRGSLSTGHRLSFVKAVI